MSGTTNNRFQLVKGKQSGRKTTKIENYLFKGHNSETIQKIITKIKLDHSIV